MITAVAKERAKEGMKRPLIRCSVMITSRVLITKVNIPKVIRVIGREIRSSRGRIKRFNRPRTIPAQTKFSGADEVIAGKSTAAK
jgi:hypothetical protein